MDPIEAERTRQMESCIPDIWEHKSYLYIGANEKRFHYSEKLRELAAKGQAALDVVEFEPERCRWLEQQAFIRRVIWADVCYWSTGTLSRYDVALWSHGPACIPSRMGLERTLDHLKSICGLLVTMCPWGRYSASPPVEFSPDHNFLALYPEFFTERGFSVNTIGQVDVPGSNLLAWWRGSAKPNQRRKEK